LEELIYLTESFLSFAGGFCKLFDFTVIFFRAVLV